MAWDIKAAAEFNEWWKTLTEAEMEDVRASVVLLREKGPLLDRPHVDSLKGSRHKNMKELRVQHAGEPYRIFFAFDPERAAILLIGGSKKGDNRFYKKMVPLADAIFDSHLATLDHRDTKKGGKHGNQKLQ